MKQFFAKQYGSISLIALTFAYATVYYFTGEIQLDNFYTIATLAIGIFGLRVFGEASDEEFFQKRILAYLMLVGFHIFSIRSLFDPHFEVSPEFLRIYAVAVGTLFGVPRLNFSMAGIQSVFGKVVSNRGAVEGNPPSNLSSIITPSEEVSEDSAVEPSQPKITSNKTTTLIDLCKEELGVTEIPGKASHPRILEYAEIAGFATYTNDDTAWCSLFMNAMATIANLSKSNSLSAKSWLKVGTAITFEEAKTDPSNVIGIWHRGNSTADWQGHVAALVKVVSKDAATFIGGNQSNSVTQTNSNISNWRFIGFRRLN